MAAITIGYQRGDGRTACPLGASVLVRTVGSVFLRTFDLGTDSPTTLVCG